MTKPLFELRADATLDAVRATYANRGSEYSDTWRTCQFRNMKAVASKLGLSIDDAFYRALAAAAFVDMKQERQSGGYKEDNLIDGIAYEALLVGEMNSLTSVASEPPKPEYRFLKQGETIIMGDEYKTINGNWVVAEASIGALVGGLSDMDRGFRRRIN